jgi:hypothetical protein
MLHVRIKRKRRVTREPARHLMEVVTPRTNSALISPAEHLCAGLSLHARATGGSAVGLEIVADQERCRFVVRAQSDSQLRRLMGQVGAAYPQAVLRPLDCESLLSGDPLQVGPDEQIACCVMRLRAGDYLPIRIFQDRDLDADAGSAQTDPVLGVLGTMWGLSAGWRMVSQLAVVEPAQPDWARAYQRLALEHPISAERQSRGQGGTSLGSVISIFGLGVGALVGLNTWSAWQRGEWSTVVLAIVGLIAAVALGLAAYVRFGRRELHDPKLVEEKLRRDACRAQLRLAVIAPAGAARADVQARLDRLAAAYRPFAVGAGNSFVPTRVKAPTADLRILGPLGRANVLNTRELAGLWHLPQAADDVPFVERTTARRRLPLPATVAAGPGYEGCQIGTSEHQGHSVAVSLAPGLLRRHLLAIAKTRRGKSSLMLRLIHHLMLAGTTGPGGRGAGSGKRCIILVDPHSDLATAALGLVPAERYEDVVYLDIANRKRPFGVNLLDVGLGWDRDQAVGNALRVFRREFDAFWGPRMEDAFRFALMALFEANEAMCHVDPEQGRSSQHTVLEVPDLLGIPRFRNGVLKRTSDPAIKHWFSSYFDPLELRHRQEIINPVQTKVHKYAGSKVARGIVGQPRSTIDFRDLIARDRIVLINLHAFEVIEDTAALIGGTLLNLAARAVSSQSSLPPDERRSVTMAVDEFHTIPGADYEQVFGELAKYGANMILATQTLSRLDRLTEGDRTRDLRAAVFSNLDGLFAFHTSAEDAEYLAEELGGGLNKQDLLELGHYQCYARITDVRNGERLPAFSVRLDAPPESDSTVADRLAAVSADRYGRSVIDVELDLEAAAARIRYSNVNQAGGQEGASPTADSAGHGAPSPARTPVGGQVPNRRRGNASSKNGATGRPRQERASDRRGGPDAAHQEEEPAA